MTPAAMIEAAPAEVAAPRRPTFRNPRRLLAAGLGAGVLANAWFTDAPLGVGFPLFALCFVICLRTLGGKESWQRAGAARWLLAPMLACAAFVAVRDSPTLTTLNLWAVVGLACLCVQLFSGERDVSSLGVRGMLGATLAGAFRSAFAGPVVVADAVRSDGTAQAVRAWLKPALRGAVFAVPVLVLFGALLASADEVFSTLVSRAFSSSSDVDGTLSTLGVVSGATLCCAGLWAWAFRRREPAPQAPALGARGFQLQAVESFAVVGSLGVLFAGFSAIQAACLFGQIALPEELTWSEYARQGFFQLLVVAGLTLALLTGLSRVSALPSPLARLFAAACTAVVALTLLILASAVKRLTLYEDAYGFTELRVFSHVFAYALGAMLLWRAVTLWKWKESFAVGALAGLVGFVLALDLLNPDAFIARKNLERFANNGDVDTTYLETLSADATPVLFEAFEKMGRPGRFEDHRSHNARRTGGGWASANLARWDASRSR